VPVLEDGDLVLFESGAICEYLCETYDPDGLWRRPGGPERTDWLRWLHFAETIGQHVAALAQQHIVIWQDADRSPVVMKIEARRLERTYAVLEAALAGRAYLLRSGFSAVDTGVGYSLYAARHFAPLEPWPNLAAYVTRLSARPAFRASLPPDGAALIFAQPFYAAGRD
jgi:glutathione S-transferase